MSITVRKPRFELPERLDPVFIAYEPEESYVNVAMSLLLPHLEPYLIRTMRRAKPRVTSDALARDLDAFCGQEGQHYRTHAALNAAFRGGGARGHEALEQRLARDYERFSAEKSLAFNLAYAEGFEALTSAMALMFETYDRSSWHPAVNDVFTWHMAEELEHRTVAFEVFEHVVGSYPYRMRVGAFAQWHLLRFLTQSMEAMLACDPRTESTFGGRAGRKQREPRRYTMLLGRVFPQRTRNWSPRYTPRALPVSPALGPLLEGYTARSTLRA